MRAKGAAVKNLLLAFMAIIIYRLVNDLYFIGAYRMLPEPYIMNHYFMLDTFFCIGSELIFFLWLWWLYRRGEFEYDSEWSDEYNFQDILITVLGMSGISTVWFLLVEMVLNKLPIIANSMESFDETWSTIDTEAYIWVFLSVVVVGPIVEECMFRGLMFHYLEKVRGGWFPILMTGICFGLWHREPVQVVYTAILGVIISIIYAYCRDLKVVIAIHMLNNMLSTLPPFLATPSIQQAIFYLSLFAIIPTLLMVRNMIRAQRLTGSRYR